MHTRQGDTFVKIMRQAWQFGGERDTDYVFKSIFKAGQCLPTFCSIHAGCLLQPPFWSSSYLLPTPLPLFPHHGCGQNMIWLQRASSLMFISHNFASAFFEECCCSAQTGCPPITAVLVGALSSVLFIIFSLKVIKGARCFTQALFEAINLILNDISFHQKCAQR